MKNKWRMCNKRANYAATVILSRPCIPAGPRGRPATSPLSEWWRGKCHHSGGGPSAMSVIDCHKQQQRLYKHTQYVNIYMHSNTVLYFYIRIHIHYYRVVATIWISHSLQYTLKLLYKHTHIVVAKISQYALQYTHTLLYKLSIHIHYRVVAAISHYSLQYTLTLLYKHTHTLLSLNKHSNTLTHFYISIHIH